MLKTQKDRGISYWRYFAKVASNPNIVGLHWFQYFDPPKKCYDPMASNWGVVNDVDEPYEEAVNFISQANKMVYAYALGLSDFSPGFDNFFSKEDKNRLKIQDGSLKNVIIPLKNPDFEYGEEGWSLQAWKGKSKVLIDSSTKYAGLKSLKIEGGPDESWGSVGVGVQYSPSFILKPDYQYKLSARIKTKNVEDSAFVRIKVKYKTGEAGYFETPGVYGDKEWEIAEVIFTPRDDNEVEYIGAELVGKGLAWFDNITLEVSAPRHSSGKDFIKIKNYVSQKVKRDELAEGELKNTKKMPISNAGFEKGKADWGLQAWKGNPSIKIDNRIAHSGNNSLRIKGAEEGWKSVGVAIKTNFDFTLKANRNYLLGGWIKSNDIKNSAFIRIKTTDADEKTKYFQTSHQTKEKGWCYAFTELSPKKEYKIKYLTCQLVGKGTSWFDDISLKEIIE